MSDIHALSGAYAVDALDDAERAQFEQHLASCDICRAEVDGLQETAALLAETTMTAPVPDLRARILADISTVRPLPPETEPGQHAEPAAVGSSVVTELAPRRRRRAATFLAAAAAAVAIVGGGVVVQELTGDDPTRVEQIQAASDVRHFDTDLGNGASATVYVSKKRNEAAIVTHNMPAAPSGKQFVLWLRHDDTMTQAGVMPEGPDNEVVLSGDAASANGAAVSIEDAGTAPTAPSDDVVAAFSFDA